MKTQRYQFILGILAAACLAVSTAVAVSKPNIVLVMADDQGWAQTGYMGHPLLEGKTPHLDAMAQAGLRFDRFYAAAPVCSATRASVLTGRTPARTGVPGLHRRLCLQEKNYTEGKVIQPQRGESWSEMKEYQQLYPTFQKLDPSWNPPGKGKRKRNE